MSLIERRHEFLVNDDCLNIVNTQFFERGKKIDFFETYEHMVHWLRYQEYVDPGTEALMLSEPDESRDDILKRVQVFRGELRRIASLLSSGRPLNPSHIEPINRELREESSFTNIALINSNVKKSQHSHHTQSSDPVLLFAQYAVELLTAKDISFVKKCMNPDCTMYFYDISKNSSRRWCCMKKCGNRMKAALYYKKTKSGQN